MAKARAKPLYTIGYEGRSPEAFMDALRAAGVRTLLDARIRPQSRKPGFSKSALAKACEAAGLEYIHDRALGTPVEMMQRIKASGKGYTTQFREAFRKHLLKQTEALGAACETASASPTCLLCYEADPADCHRAVVAEEMAKRAGFKVQHL